MPSYGVLRRVAFLRTDISEELIASVIRLTSIGELGISQRALVASYSNAVPSPPILFTLMMEAIRSSETA
jgi:hypothetical protein